MTVLESPRGDGLAGAVPLATQTCSMPRR
ncbi:MAG: hypothetical protein QOH87_3661, partial [Trebonia sp.]|nr:hypothetical protein [Trebonia sp.]